MVDHLTPVSSSATVRPSHLDPSCCTICGKPGECIDGGQAGRSQPLGSRGHASSPQVFLRTPPERAAPRNSSAETDWTVYTEN